MRSNFATGMIYAMGMVLLFGLYTPAAKGWLGQIAPFSASALLYWSAAVTLAAVSVCRSWCGYRLDGTSALCRRDWPILILGAGSGALASPVLLFGLKHVSGTVGSLLGNLEGVFTLAIALWFGDSLGKLELAGATAILGGSFLLGSLGPSAAIGFEWLGALAVIAACLGWAIDNTTTQRLSLRDPLILMAAKCVVAGSISWLLAFVAHDPPPSPGSVQSAAIIGAAGWAGSMVCFALAMRHLGAARVGSLLSLAPFAGAIGSILMLGERPTATILEAGAIMAIGVTLLALAHRHQLSSAM